MDAPALLPVPAASAVQPKGWRERYGQRHRWHRFDAFPTGFSPPRKVRVYRRAERFLLNWWDPAERKNLSERIDGDLLSALARAREIDERIATLRTAGVLGTRRLAHSDLVASYLADLGRRADADEIDSKTVRRYRAALQHYLVFIARPEVVKRFPSAGMVDRAFRLEFTSFLATRVSSVNRNDGMTRPMKRPDFVLDVVRGSFEWACDPDRGRLLPDGFRNPFLSTHSRASLLQGDPLAAPDVTFEMAIDLIRACDDFQLRLIVPTLCFGLRAAEPCSLFAEHIRDGWLSVPCMPELGLLTKGRRDKRFPLIEELNPFWKMLRGGRDRGLLLERRSVSDNDGKTPLRTLSLEGLIGEYRLRCGRTDAKSALDRSRVRDAVLRDAGALSYDHAHREFSRLAKGLGWPTSATLKDLRHLFATTLNNAGVPEGYRRYLLGHSPGKAAIVAYTHLDQLRKHY